MRAVRGVFLFLVLGVGRGGADQAGAGRCSVGFRAGAGRFGAVFGPVSVRFSSLTA